jgi:hypothetical protein
VQLTRRSTIRRITTIAEQWTPGLVGTSGRCGGAPAFTEASARHFQNSANPVAPGRRRRIVQPSAMAAPQWKTPDRTKPNWIPIAVASAFGGLLIATIAGLVAMYLLNFNLLAWME